MAAKKASARSKGKATVKKKVVKKVVLAKKTTMPVVKDPLTKGGIVKALMDMTALPKKDIAAVLDGIGTLIELHVKSRGPGKFVMPGLMKIAVIKKTSNTCS